MRQAVLGREKIESQVRPKNVEGQKIKAKIFEIENKYKIGSMTTVAGFMKQQIK